MNTFVSFGAHSFGIFSVTSKSETEVNDLIINHADAVMNQIKGGTIQERRELRGTILDELAASVFYDAPFNHNMTKQLCSYFGMAEGVASDIVTSIGSFIGKVKYTG